jgi:hypothetical protein
LKNLTQNEESIFKGPRVIGIQKNSPLQVDEPAPQHPKSRAKLFLIVSGTLFVIFISIEMIFHSGSADSNGPSMKRTVAIQLEVLNGTTEPKIAQKITEALRAGGFDVVDMKNYKVSNVDRTTIIGRTADKSPALTVASYLGIDKSLVLQQPDKNLYIDVTVIIGRDINQLHIFKWQ